MSTANSQPSVSEVQDFWNANPLFTGESHNEPGSLAWFEEHAETVVQDCFAGRFDDRTLPPAENRTRVLDLGCGPGFWTVELQKRCAIGTMTAADLTPNALELTRKRLACYDLNATVEQQNAEELRFAAGSFDHVNCQGVIHHTPETGKCVAEIARVLRPGGTASISVYYRNWILRNWGWIGSIGPLLSWAGARLKGRGREGIYAERDADDVVRMYDGAANPIGKAYDESQFRQLLEPHLAIEELYFHFFPARSLPIGIPPAVHRLLDRQLPFMIYANVRKL